MPKYLGIKDNMVFLECEFMPSEGDEVLVAEYMSQNFCSHCGLRIDCDQRGLSYSCFSLKAMADMRREAQSQV